MYDFFFNELQTSYITLRLYQACQFPITSSTVLATKQAGSRGKASRVLGSKLGQDIHYS